MSTKRQTVALLSILTLVAAAWPAMVARASLSDSELDDAAAATVLLSASIMEETEGGDTTVWKQCFLGSGTMISDDGWVLTNHHVIASIDIVEDIADAETDKEADNTEAEYTVDDAIFVSVVDDTKDTPTQRYRAVVEEKEPGWDLALLRITGYAKGRTQSFEDLPYFLLGSSLTMSAQEEITVIGYPGTPTDEGATTSGGDGEVIDDQACASMPDRPIRYYSDELSGVESDELGMFEVDVTASPGISGGAAVDEDGNLVGVPTRIDTRMAGGVVNVTPVERVWTWLEEIDREDVATSTDPVETEEPEEPETPEEPDPSPTPIPPEPTPTPEVTPDPCAAAGGNTPVQSSPGGSAAECARQSIELTYTYAYVGGSNPYEVSVYLNGTPAQLETIESVTYYLHPTFTPSTVTIETASNGFMLVFNTWGEFTIQAEALFFDGSTLQFSLDLQYD